MMKMLRRALPAALLGAIAIAGAQQATERFIPLGQSPGLSGRSTLIGTIGADGTGAAEFSVRSEAGVQRVRVTPATRIWLDRSKSGQSSLAGTPAELRAGRLVEVKFADAVAPAAAEWIKVEMPALP